MNKQYYVYIMSNEADGVLYIGSTSNLVNRVFQHKDRKIEGFSKKYSTTFLVHFEVADNPISMVERERQLKHWKREWKVRLINESNPGWKDLSTKF